MSFTIGKSYGTGRNYRVPNYNVNTQSMMPPVNTSQPGTAGQQPANSPANPSAPNHSQNTPSASTMPATPGSGNTPSAPGFIPGSGSGTAPSIPGFIPGSGTGTTPSTSIFTPGTGTVPSRTGSPTTYMTPGTGTTPGMGNSPARTTTPPVTPSTGTGTSPARTTTPPVTPGTATGTSPAKTTTPPVTPTLIPGLSTPPSGSAAPSTPGTGTIPSRTGTPSPMTVPPHNPASVPFNPGSITTPRSSTPGIPAETNQAMPGATSQELPFVYEPQPAQASPFDQHYNFPSYMNTNMQPGMTSGMQPAVPIQPGMTPGMQPSVPMQPGMTPGMTSDTQQMIFPYYNYPAMPNEMPNMNYPAYQGIPNMYLPNQNQYTAPMGIPLFPLYGYDNSSELDRDIEYMKQLYPGTAKTIQSEINNECDQMEYDGSVMFDEYPDKVYLERIIDRIYEKMKDLDEEPQVEANSLYFYPTRQQNNYLHDLVSILLLNEMFNRRRRYRGKRRWF